MATHTISIRPNWERLCEAAERGDIKPIYLMPACKIAEIICKAQEDGHKKVVFSFTEGKTSAEIEVL